MLGINSLRLTKQNVVTALFILFLILLTFLPRLFSLSVHWATDEDLWMQRSRNFYFALKNGEFEDTHVAYHPGVTTCWLGSLAIWLTAQPSYFNSWLHSDQFMSPGMLARVRFPIVFLSGILTLIAGLLLYRLFDALHACIGTLFLAIEPFLISESRRAHTDVLTALFLFLALLLWLCYLEGETRKPRWNLVLSGICFGLACLTKSHAGALTITHPAPTPFLGVSRYNPGFLFYPVMWFVWTGILTLPLIIFTMCRTWQIRQKEGKIFRIVVVMLLFTVFYLIGLSFVAQKTSRYIVIFLPVISLLTAMGVMQLAQLLHKRWLTYLILITVFCIQAVPILRLYPYYRAYYHPLLSAKWVEERTAPITGAGLDLAADYLNAKPDAERLRVRHTWFCKDFARYFIGETGYYKYDPSTHNFDYDLEYLYDRQIIHTPMDTSEDITYRRTALKRERTVRRELEHVVSLNGIDYVWIYRIIKPESTNNTDKSSE